MSASTRVLRVERLTRLADDVVEVRLVDPAGTRLPPWEPGAHVAIDLPNGLTRQYSLCGPEADDASWTIAVHRPTASRGGSAYVHDGLRIGALLPVTGPRNDFRLEPADRHLLVAGGIGITPILAMARRLRATGADWALLYCGRSRAAMAFLAEVAAWEPERVRIHVDDEAGGPADLAVALAAHAGALVHCCGPEPMLADVERLAPDPALVRVERFRAPEPAAPPPGGDAPFDVVCAGSGLRVRVEPEESALDALARAGVAVPSSCGEGICGTCETKVLDGVPEHRDHVLSDAERAAGGSMFVCVSRARTAELVLDLP
jgi:tetrachlorobenzoquinone reductase